MGSPTLLQMAMSLMLAHKYHARMSLLEPDQLKLVFDEPDQITGHDQELLKEGGWCPHQERRNEWHHWGIASSNCVEGR